MRLSVARWMRAPIASGADERRQDAGCHAVHGHEVDLGRAVARKAGRDPGHQQRAQAVERLVAELGERFLSAPEGVHGRVQHLGVAAVVARAGLADHDRGQELRDAQPLLHQGAVGLDRRHRLGQLVVVVVEVAREDERVLLRDRALAAAVDVGGLDRHVRHEARPGRRLQLPRELERVPAAEHVRAERALVGVVERNARGTVHDVRQLAAQLPELRGVDPESRLLDVALDEAEARLRLAAHVKPLQQERSPLAGGEHLDHPLGLAVAQRLGPHHRHHLLDVGVGGRLCQELLAHEAGRPGQQHAQPGTPAERREPRARLFLQLRDARLHLAFREMGRLAELEHVVARGDADQTLHAGRVGRVPGQARHDAAEASPQGLDALQPGLDEPLVAGHVDQPAREELGRDLHRVAVAVSVHQEIGRLDRVADGLAGGAVQLDDVLARRHVDARADLRRDRLSSAGHGTREPTPWGERSQRC